MPFEVRRRMKSPLDRPDFMYHFLRQAEKEQLSKPVIEAQASVVILAGSETSATALTAAIYCIVGNAVVYEKICDEVRTTFKKSTDINLSDVLARLPYLEACVKETLRIHSPLANGFTRYVADKDGTKISNKWVPHSVRA